MTTTFSRVDGEGPPLVLIHGVGLDHTMWDRVVEGLATRHRVLRYDLLGHGDSHDPPGARQADDFVEQFLEVLNSHDLEDSDVVGLSLGGLIALLTAARQPRRVRRLVLASTVFGRSERQLSGVQQRLALAETEGLGPVADLAVERWFTSNWRATHGAAVESIRQRLRTTDLAGYLKAYRLFVEADGLASASAADVEAPTLVLAGERDSGSTPEMARALAAAIPTARVQIMAGVHHLPPIEAPETFASVLIQFLDQENTS